MSQRSLTLRYGPRLKDSTSKTSHHRAKGQGTVRIAFDRPDVRNAFRPGTVDELYTALDHAPHEHRRWCRLAYWKRAINKRCWMGFLLWWRSANPEEKDGYKYADGETSETIDPAQVGRLHILECQGS